MSFSDSLSKARILVVEDEPVLRDTLVQILNLCGFDSAGAENGKLALEAIAENSFDLVLSDVQMPVMGGIELLKNIKDRFPSLKVVFFSAFADLSPTQAMEMGALDLLFKPVGVDLLVEKINGYLKATP